MRADEEKNDGKMKICMFGQKRIPSNEGGVEVVVEELSIRMVEKGFLVTCYNRKGHHVSGAEFDGKKLSTYKGVRLKEVFTVNKKGLAAVTSSAVSSIAAAFGKYDVVHIHAEGPAFFCWIPKLFGKKVIVSIHGLDHQRAKWGKFASAYIMHGEKNAVKFADEIIVLSKNIQKYFKDTYGRKTSFIPNGVNVPKIKNPELISEKFGLEKNSYILYLGRIVPEKGEQYLIEAFKNVKTEKKLVIAGGSSDTEMFMNKLRKMAEDDKRIIFTGFVQGDIKHELYSNAYVYTLPSDVEGMPLSLLEGMSYGNCCLISDIAEFMEVVGDKAVTFKRGDVEDLREKIQMLCDDEFIVFKFKSAAQAYVLEKYDWDNVVNRTLDLYKNHIMCLPRKVIG